MLHEDSIRAVDASAIPLYDSYCFANLPAMIAEALGLEHGALGSGQMPRSCWAQGRASYERVVLCLLDGMGWELLARHLDHPLVARVLAQGVLSKISSQFPSTTAAHMTTLHTGQPVGQHGVFEWLYYEPHLARIFAPLLYQSVGPDSMQAVEDSPSTLFPEQSLATDLARQGVRSLYVIEPPRAARSPFTRWTCRDATIVASEALGDSLASLSAQLARSEQKTYAQVYVDTIDALSHRCGPDDPQVDRALIELLDTIDASLGRLGGEETLLLISADHGQIGTMPEETIYLDLVLPQLEGWMQTSADGSPLAPAGGRRDCFLYVKPEHLEQACAALSAALEGRAQVLRTSQAIERGLFGPQISARLTERLGNVLVLPEGDAMVWWWGDGRHAVRGKRGDHGGLSPQELHIPLLALALG